MNKLIIAAASLLALSSTAAFAQGFTYPAPSAQTLQARKAHASGAHTWSAYSRNVGPGSTVDGYAADSLGSRDSGAGHSATAPSAGHIPGNGN